MVSMLDALKPYRCRYCKHSPDVHAWKYDDVAEALVPMACGCTGCQCVRFRPGGLEGERPEPLEPWVDSGATTVSMETAAGLLQASETTIHKMVADGRLVSGLVYASGNRAVRRIDLASVRAASVRPYHKRVDVERTSGIVLFWLAVAALWALDAWVPHPAGVTRAEFGSSPAATLITIGAGVLGLFRGKIDKNVKVALDGLRFAMVRGFEVVSDFMKDSGKKQSGLVGILRRFWDAGLLPLIRKIDGKINRLRQWLKDTIGPIVAVLLKLRKRILDFYGKWFKPIFDTIDAVRGILRVLGVLHVDFARKLDEKLARLESWVLKLFEKPLEKINELVNFSERVMDLDGFFQRYTLVRSQILHVRDTFNVLFHSQNKPLTDEERSAALSRDVVKPFEQTLADGRAYILHGTGPDAAVIEEMFADLRLRLSSDP